MLRFTCFLSALLAVQPQVISQVTSWIEDAEMGLENVVDFTAASYPLIQSSVVSEGRYAFHIANPDFNDNWFELDRTISVESGASLFFASRLGGATPDQFARVQLSTDMGDSWPIEVFSQAGSGFPGESSFQLQAIPLDDYHGQDVRLRFLLDFDAPGSAFTQTDVSVGWIVDDIQVRSEFEKAFYSIGDPSPEETLYLELINRSRADATAEAQRLSESTDTDVRNALNFFSIRPRDIVSQFEWAVSSSCFAGHAQPLAFNEPLLRMSELHSEDQEANNFQGHTSSGNPPEPFRAGDRLGDRAARVGYSSFSRLAENVFASATSVEHGHAGFEIDWGILNRPGNSCYNSAFSDQGMQNPAGHRANIHSGAMNEVGIGVVQKDDGLHVVTQNMGASANARFATGVVYEDENGNGFYDIGEGREGIRVDSDESAFYAVSSASGAYALPISSDGETTIAFSRTDRVLFESDATFADGLNVKVDYVFGRFQVVLGDFDNNGILDVADLDALTAIVRNATHDGAFDLDGNGVVDQADRFVWVHEIKNVYFGDSDLNGEFDSGDFVLMFRRGEYEDGVNGNSTWATGDFNGDAEFDSGDFVFAFRDNGYEKGPRPAIAIPESTGTMVLFWTWLFIAARKRSC